MSAPASALQLTLSPDAIAALQRFLVAEGLDQSATAVTRLQVTPGGCSGFKYHMIVEDAPHGDDLVIEPVAGIRFAVDPFSAQYLEGLFLDYKETMTAAGFVFQNPNATGGCGCGSSFSA